MSEAERKRRVLYKKNRKKWMLIQMIAISVLFAVALGCFSTYYKLNQNHYIGYSESGKIDYKVSLNDNEFYEEELKLITMKASYEMLMWKANLITEYINVVKLSLKKDFSI